MFSVLRIAVAYVVSLVFTRGVRIHRGVQRPCGTFMIPLLDTLQSIPVLSFLPGVMVAMVALFPDAPARRGAGIDPADFYRASVEHGVQLLFVAEKHSARDARGGGDLSLELVAAIHANGAALFAPSGWCGIR